jgi:hypothetical protein
MDYKDGCRIPVLECGSPLYSLSCPQSGHFNPFNPPTLNAGMRMPSE